MAKSIDIVISTILKKTGIDAAKAQIKQFAASVGRNLANIKAGFDLAASGVRTLISAMSKGMEFERMTLQFKQLTGSMDEARAHMQDLQDLGRTPPFDLESFASASREMMKLSGGVLGFRKEMELAGDVAAATGSDLASVSRAIGLAYQSVRDGVPFGRAASQLVHLGALTRKQVAYFDELSKHGVDNAVVWAELTAELGRYKGAMSETEKTTKGLVDAIQGETVVALTTLSSEISENAKPMLEVLLGKLKALNEDGSIEMWAARMVDAFEEVKTGAETFIKPVISIIDFAMSRIKAYYMTMGESVGNFVGTIAGGGSVGDAFSMAVKGAKQGVVDATDSDGAEAAHYESRRERARARRAKKRAEESAKLEADAAERQAADLARAQAETNKKIEEKKAEEAAKTAKKEEERRLKAVAEEQRARQKMEDELHAQRVANIQSELKGQQDAQHGAQNAASSAKTEFDKAFAMYRDGDLAARTIQEERDYAADYKRLGRDANRYGGKWRIDELASLISAGDTAGQAARLEEWRRNSKFTPEVEAMVRASAADKARTTAEDELRKISHNTEALSDKLDELLKVKG